MRVGPYSFREVAGLKNRIAELEEELAEQKEDTETIHTDYTDAVTKLLDEEEENAKLNRIIAEKNQQIDNLIEECGLINNN